MKGAAHHSGGTIPALLALWNEVLFFITIYEKDINPTGY